MAKNQDKDVPLRLDKWLWCSRFYKTRSIAADAIKTGKVISNGERAKPSKTVKVDDQLNIRKGPFHYEITVLQLAKSRKSAKDAALMYEESDKSIQERELTVSRIKAEAVLSPTTKGRPTKRDRRQIIKFKNS